LTVFTASGSIHPSGYRLVSWVNCNSRDSTDKNRK